MSGAIRLLDLESNLPPPSSTFGTVYRVELLVNSSWDGHTGPPVWAPLCATPADVALYEEDGDSITWMPAPVANVSCNQVSMSVTRMPYDEYAVHTCDPRLAFRRQFVDGCPPCSLHVHADKCGIYLQSRRLGLAAVTH
jgi:hypothetical protein